MDAPVGSNPMRRLLLVMFAIMLLAACQQAAPIDQNTYARQWLDNANKKDVKITKVVAGNPKNHKADALYCVETDATTPEGQTYLAAIWRTGSTWSGAQMADGEYEWDLNGCPRD